MKAAAESLGGVFGGGSGAAAQQAGSGGESGDEESGDVYEVADIVAVRKRKQGGGLEYRIRWAGGVRRESACVMPATT